MRRYPDQAEEPLLKLKWQSGSMGLYIHCGGILTISTCPSGLRVGILRLFGIFCRDFFVSWSEISVTRKAQFFLPVTKLQFGNPSIGRLTIAARVANRLGRSAPGKWPEAGPFPDETRCQIFQRLAKMWLDYTSLASIFFIVTSRIVAPNVPYPPVMIDILFPAIVFGFFFLIHYFVQINRLARTRPP
jgi:hypothetical protein